MLTLGPNNTLAAKVDAVGTDVVYDTTMKVREIT